MKQQTINAASSGKALPVEKLAEGLVRSSEIVTLFNEDGAPGLITVLGKFQVTPMIYHLVAHQLESIHVNLIRDIEYTPSDLIGDEYWSRFGAPGKREMELCLKHFAANPEAKLLDTETGTFELAD